ncbi:uncharacterized protein LOC129272090 [Lytechinus pictus]|uniref:uncharacterized protein LOC129272090 n=1 Tax=Lytechinus pictus TaxID=7653 RepID=UPI0030BA1314
MTAISVPLNTKEEKDAPETRTTRDCSLLVIAVVVTLLTLVAFAVSVLYATILCTAPSCGLHKSHPRAHDMNFQAHGTIGDTDFDDDFHYDHKNNVLVKKITSQSSKDNATVLHDFTRGVTTYVLPMKKRCFVGALETDSYDMVLHAHNGGFSELSNHQARQYFSQGIISPPFLERTAGPLVLNHCLGLETSWIEAPSIQPSVEGASIEKRRPLDTEIVILPDGTIIITR